jgi:16S rRNA (guanine527-N7)-methyltransferase
VRSTGGGSTLPGESSRRALAYGKPVRRAETKSPNRFPDKKITNLRGVGRELRNPPRDIGKLLDRQPWELVEEQLARVGADPAVALPRVRRYAELLLEWNRGFSNLISSSDESRLVERHILESLTPAAWIREAGPSRIMDFGSGGGFPAVPLFLAGVGERWLLVESRRNKTLFLRKVSEELGLRGLEVELARLEVLLGESDRIGKFDAFTSRATIRLGPTLALASNWVRAGGSAFLWKGSRKSEEMSDDERWKRSWDPADTFDVGNGQTSVSRFVRKTA